MPFGKKAAKYRLHSAHLCTPVTPKPFAPNSPPLPASPLRRAPSARAFGGRPIPISEARRRRGVRPRHPPAQTLPATERSHHGQRWSGAVPANRTRPENCPPTVWRGWWRWREGREPSGNTRRTGEIKRPSPSPENRRTGSEWFLHHRVGESIAKKKVIIIPVSNIKGVEPESCTLIESKRQSGIKKVAQTQKCTVQYALQVRPSVRPSFAPPNTSLHLDPSTGPLAGPPRRCTGNPLPPTKAVARPRPRRRRPETTSTG